jgi:hypothetical protein
MHDPWCPLITHLSKLQRQHKSRSDAAVKHPILLRISTPLELQMRKLPCPWILPQTYLWTCAQLALLLLQ